MPCHRRIAALAAGILLAPLVTPVLASAEPQSAVDRMDAAVRANAGLTVSAPAKKAKVTPLRSDKQGRSIVYVEGGDTAALRKAVATVGGDVSDSDRGRVRAAVPAGALEKLAGSAGVTQVRRPETPVEMEIVSEEVQPSGALAWHGTGQQGTGVKVGVIDVGFGRLDEAQANNEVPANSVVHNGLCGAEHGSSHGTTMAEIVHDMAPQAQLFLACVTDSMDFDDAARWLKDQGVAVVNVSLGFPASGRGSGLPDPNEPEWTPATVASWLRGNGIVVVAAAGNEADKHMTGPIADPDGNGWLNISGASENQGFTMAAGATVTVSLQWDAWPRTTSDLDLFVMDQLGKPAGLNDPHLGGRYSVRQQKETAGGLAPTETVTFTNTTTQAQTYWAYTQIKQTTGARYDLTIYGNANGVQFVNPAGSIAEPATSPYVLAVGAITPANAAGGSVEGYSSRGPTIDGRIKPDITAFTNVSTYTGGATRNGTSVAAAHVAGAAAVYKGANPSLDPAQLESVLLDSSTRAGRGNDLGYGVLNLGTPRVPQPPAGSAFTPLSTFRRVLDTATDVGGHRSILQDSETFTLRIPDLPADTTAVMIDMTAVQPSVNDTSLEVFADTPTGTPSLHAVRGRYTSAFLTATLHPVDKVIRIRNSGNAVNLIIDLFGYYSDQSSASTYTPKGQPSRLLDTRTWGMSSPTLDLGEVQTVKVRDVAGVPSNATAAMVSVTAIPVAGANTASHIEVFGQTARSQSTLIAYPNEEQQNLVMVPIGDDGSIRIKNYAGGPSVHAVVELVGWYATGTTGARYVPLRFAQTAFDTFTGTQTTPSAIGVGQTRTFQMTRQPRVPLNATAAALSTTVSRNIAQPQGQDITRVALWCEECGWSGHSDISNLMGPVSTNIGHPIVNTIVAPLRASGTLVFRNAQGSTAINAVLTGYFTGGQVAGDAPAPPPTGHWKFDEGTGTTAADSSGNGRTATLQGGATWNSGRMGKTSWLNGTTAYASTAGSVLRTDQSFTVSAWVYLTKKDDWYTAITQNGGTQTVPFVVQYNKFFDRWIFLATTADQANPGEQYVLSAKPANLSEWTHLTAAYNATTREMRLYVNGAMDGVISGSTIWRGDGPFTIGRGKTVQNWPGGIDDVRTYDRALVDSEVRDLHRATGSVLFSQWKFDEGTGTVAADSTARKLNGTLTGGASWTAGAIGQAVAFNGSSASVEMPGRGIVSTDSFTITAWANTPTTALWRDVVTQNGNRRSAFALTSAPNGQWMFVATPADDDGSASVAAASAPGALNQWTHLAGVYDAAARQLRLYVNGNLVSWADGATMWSAPTGFAVGRGKWQGTLTDYFAGAIDEVRTYQGMLTETEIRALATR